MYSSTGRFIDSQGVPYFVHHLYDASGIVLGTIVNRNPTCPYNTG